MLLCASGTEAPALARRSARAYTGKDAIGVFDGSYHGAHDYGLIVAAPSKNGTKAHVGAGIPNAVDSLVEPLIFGSSEAFERIRELRNSLAAVIVEPIQSSCPLSDGGAWLRELEQVCRDCNVLVILDEIMTGFRLAYGGGQELFELSPDLVTYGKSLAGGTPVGAVAGKADVMQMFTPDSRGVCVFAGSAFAGNPITVAAGQTTLAYLMDNKSTLYDTLNQKTAQLVSKVNTFWSEANMPLRLIAFGSMVRFVCQSEPVRRSTDINSKLRHAEDVFMVHVLDHGVMIHASRRGFISTAHTEKDIDLVANALIGASYETAADGFFRDI